jgi:hypothetical protein
VERITASNLERAGGVDGGEPLRQRRNAALPTRLVGVRQHSIHLSLLNYGEELVERKVWLDERRRTDVRDHPDHARVREFAMKNHRNGHLVIDCLTLERTEHRTAEAVIVTVPLAAFSQRSRTM